MGAQLREQFRAGWVTGSGEVVTFSHVDGPGSFRFEVTSPQGRTFVFGSVGEVATALYRADGTLSARMSSEQAAELICAGAARGGYVAAAQAARDTVWNEQDGHVYQDKRHKAARSLADRIVCLTRRADLYAGFPQWHPAWRIDELESAAVPAPRTEQDSASNVFVGVA